MASMKLSKACINLVKSYEGYHKKLPNGDCTTYYCPANVLTIGYGCTEGITKGEVWTHAQAIEALRREMEKHEAAVNRLVKAEISQNAFDALVSFSYNCGYGALGKSTLLKKVNKSDFAGAAAEFHKWNKGGGKVLPGLVRRRAQEAEMFLTADASTEPVMAQAVDTPAPVKAAVASSWTVFGGLMAFIAWLMQQFDTAIQVAMEAVAELTKFDAIKTLTSGTSIKIAAATLSLVAIGIVVGRRLHAAHTGKVG